MVATAEIKECLTKAFSSLQENVYKGKLTYSDEIQAFQKYFETVYNPMELVQTVCYAAPILKEKFEKQIAKKKFPKAGSGKPPLTPKKRKVPTENVILVEDDEEETPPTPLKKKQKKNKATISSYQTTKQQGAETKILPPPSKETQSQPFGGAEKPTTPLISTANQSDPSSSMNPSPPPTISGAIQNKGSSTGAQNLEADNVQNEQETSSPGEDGKKDLKQAEEKDSEEKEDYEDTPSNSPPRVTFPSDYADEDDQDFDEIEGYFQQDEDMSEGEANPEGNQTGTGDAIVETMPNPTNIRSSTIQTSPISLTEEEKNALKQNDPLKHVKKAVFDVDLFEELKKDVGASFGIKKMISKINITAFPIDIELQKKISDAKANQATIQGLDSTEADNLAKQSIDHVKKATAMNEDIARLGGVQAVVQYNIGLAKIKILRSSASSSISYALFENGFKIRKGPSQCGDHFPNVLFFQS
ncbi:uncharacterized protein LOC127095286 [Lathyrus oleraceus]|uniref:uncharacterized protein LOC127095286 n=1 Tax=Pisum sativum TaxID=3888 RepID=UPI0021CF95B7|nr:uncharacterized protein LOC127095286 [Pisum sativum]